MQQCLSDRSDSQCISIHQCLLDGQAVSQLVCQHLSDNQTIRTSDKLLSSVSQMIRQSDNQCVRWNQTFAMLADVRVSMLLSQCVTTYHIHMYHNISRLSTRIKESYLQGS